jgi:HEPN domain-containing protein
MSLEQWLENRWIHEHQTSAEEIRSLLSSAAEDLRGAESAEVAAGWRLAMAYTASLRYARAALAAAGYRSGREREHERLIDSLGFTIDSIDPSTIRLLHTIRKKRHAATYDSIELVSDSEAESALKLARELGEIVQSWLEAKHPSLIK